MTCAPASVSTCDRAAPRPLAPPVTRMTLPASSLVDAALAADAVMSLNGFSIGLGTGIGGVAVVRDGSGADAHLAGCGAQRHVVGQQGVERAFVNVGQLHRHVAPS